MALKKKAKTEQIKRFKAKHLEGRVKWTAKKVYDKLVKKQEKNIKRGRAGHTPVKRNVIK